MSITGRCLCGTINYSIDNPPAMTGVGHCKNCQRQAGSAFSTLAGVPISELHISGEPKLYTDPIQQRQQREAFLCGECGSPIYSAVQSSPDVVYLKTGTLDDNSTFQPQFLCGVIPSKIGSIFPTACQQCRKIPPSLGRRSIDPVQIGVAKYCPITPIDALNGSCYFIWVFRIPISFSP